MLNRSKTKRSLFVECRQYTDKTYGNTYYSARVFVDGKHLFTTGPTYGYEYQYEHDVSTELVTRGYLPAGMIGRGIRWARDAGIDVYSVAYSVGRRQLWGAEDNQEDLERDMIDRARLAHIN
jgi:hypothetical protein